MTINGHAFAEMDLPERLIDLAAQLQRLRPNWSDQRKFYEQRDNLVDQMHSIATEAENGTTQKTR